MIRVLDTDPQCSIPIARDGPPTLQDLYEWIGHGCRTVEFIPMRCGDRLEPTQMFIDEEGKLKGLPVNHLATILWHGWLAHLKTRPHDVIVGVAVLLTEKHMVD
jgi:hypothetical protein